MRTEPAKQLSRLGVVLLIPGAVIVCSVIALFRASDGNEPRQRVDRAPGMMDVASAGGPVDAGEFTSFESLISEIQKSPDYTDELSFRIGGGQRIVPQTFVERWSNSVLGWVQNGGKPPGTFP